MTSMEWFKTLWISYLLPILAVAFVASACGILGKHPMMRLCKQQYALCTSAHCIPVPGDPSKAVCHCEVQDGPSMSTVPCDQLKPSTDPNGIQTVYSTFSYKQLEAGKKVLKCPGGTPWTWCLNKRCTVDPANPAVAVCLCDVMRTTEDWITFGGGCDRSSCSASYWSGAAMKDFDEGNVFLMRKLRLAQTPIKWCEAQ